MVTPLLCESSSLVLAGKVLAGQVPSLVTLGPLPRAPLPSGYLPSFLHSSTHLSTTTLQHHNTNNMADNVGLTTPRGSGTSGYVQKNRSLLRPRDKVAPYPKDWEHAKHRPRQPDAEILEHEAKREIEVKVFELRDKLEEEGCAFLTRGLNDA
jgi:hypothetical protein